MSDVLPTLCSPRKTSLNFFSGLDAANSAPDAGADMATWLGWVRVGLAGEDKERPWRKTGEGKGKGWNRRAKAESWG